jgi:hypothetical protein
LHWYAGRVKGANLAAKTAPLIPPDKVKSRSEWVAPAGHTRAGSRLRRHLVSVECFPIRRRKVILRIGAALQLRPNAKNGLSFSN